MKPRTSAIAGAISGKLVAGYGDPFDAALLDGAPIESLQVELHNAEQGVVTSTHAHGRKPAFEFGDVRPGTYEISVYREIRGKRTIAGNEQVIVDAGQVSPVTVTLTVTAADHPR